MKTTFTPLLIALFIATPAMAEKPTIAGQGKPTAEQKDASKSAEMDKKAEVEDAEDDAKEQMKQAKESKEEKAKKSKEGKDHDHSHDDDDQEDKIKDKSEAKLKGLEKQKAMKSEQMQNELGKGSEQGQAAREENSKKWWKFW